METSCVYHPCRIKTHNNLQLGTIAAGLMECGLILWYFVLGEGEVGHDGTVEADQSEFCSFADLICVILMNIAEHCILGPPYTTSKSANVWAVWGCGDQFVTSSWRPWSIWGSDPFMPRQTYTDCFIALFLPRQNILPEDPHDAT